MRRRLQLADKDARSDLFDVLAVEAAAGDDAAAADLAWAVRHFRLARPALHQYLFKDDDLDSAEQRTMVAVALRIGSFRSEARFTTWLHRVAINEAKQLIRRESKHSSRTEAEPLEEFADHFIARMSSMVVNRERIDAEIAALPDKHRRALLLREEQGLSYGEIAAELQVPEATTKTWVRRARIELAKGLSQ